MKVMLELTPEAFSSLEETLVVQSLADSTRNVIKDINFSLSKESLLQYEVEDLQYNLILSKCLKRVLEYYTTDKQRKTEFADIFKGDNDEQEDA
jgi:hypothetical protein